jgi:hypothetical protein
MTNKPANEKSTRTGFTRRRAAGIGMSMLAGGFTLAGGSALLGGAASAASPTPGPAVQSPAALSPSVAAQLAAASAPVPLPAAAPAPLLVAAPVPASSAATTETADDAAIDAFFAAGYSYDDAVTLAKAWGSADPFETKVLAGRKLEAGEKLPIAAGAVDPATVASVAEGAQVDKFFAAGYTYDDAVQLAKIWGSTDPYQAKITAGKKLLAGQTLPVRP